MAKMFRVASAHEPVKKGTSQGRKPKLPSCLR